jgi:phosphocarrier protein HPr
MSASCEQGITLAGDLHARPAGALAVAAGRFASAVSVTAGGQTADAKSVLGVMGLGATSGQHVTVSAAGPDAQEAVAVLITILGEATRVGGLPLAAHPEPATRTVVRPGDVPVHRGGDPGYDLVHRCLPQGLAGIDDPARGKSSLGPAARPSGDRGNVKLHRHPGSLGKIIFLSRTERRACPAVLSRHHCPDGVNEAKCSPFK